MSGPREFSGGKRPWKRLRPAFHYFGGKSRYADKILRQVPEHRTWIEPFAGGASVTLAKPPSEREVLADTRADLMNFYRHIKRGELPSCKTTSVAIPNLKRIAAKPDSQRSFCDFMAFQQSTWAGDPKGGKVGQRPLAGNKPGIGGGPHHVISQQLLNNFEDYQNRLKDVTLVRGDYKDVMRRYDGPNSLFYLDPPYPYDGGSLHSFTNYDTGIPDAVDLRDFLSKRKGNIILSYPNSREVRRIFSRPGWHLKKLVVPRPLAGTLGGPKTRSELLITNFKPGRRWHGLEGVLG